MARLFYTLAEVAAYIRAQGYSEAKPLGRWRALSLYPGVGRSVVRQLEALGLVAQSPEDIERGARTKSVDRRAILLAPAVGVSSGAPLCSGTATAGRRGR